MWLTMGDGVAVRIEGDRFVVGSGPDNRLVVNDDRVESVHAFFEETDDGRYLVGDLDSEDGTYVRGERITGPTEIHDGDRIRIGGTTFVASHEEPADAKVEVAIPDPEPSRIRVRLRFA